MPERTVSKETTAQQGLSALMGLIMAKSGCPQTGPHFKPMVRFRVPLATAEGTLYRAASIYLLAQYFVNEVGGEPELKFEGLTKIYENL